MNNIRPATREQSHAAEFMADYFDSVVIGTPNQYGLVQLIGLFGDVEMLKWTVNMRGGIVVCSDWSHGVTRDYLNSPEVAG